MPGWIEGKHNVDVLNAARPLHGRHELMAKIRYQRTARRRQCHDDDDLLRRDLQAIDQAETDHVDTEFWIATCLERLVDFLFEAGHGLRSTLFAAGAQVTLGFNRRHTPPASRRDCLAVTEICHITGDENPWLGGKNLICDSQIPTVIELELPTE